MDAYRQTLPAAGLSIERHTGRVPDDGHYYVLVRGNIKGRYRALKQAQARYKELAAESGWSPGPLDRASVDPGRDAVERYLNELEEYWAGSHKHTRRGGKSMYRS
jgi:hypothetical protein